MNKKLAGGGEDSSDFGVRISTTNRRTSKRLIFDRRYGWVFDEWKDPAEEASAGGRGMFCAVPIGKGILKMASQSINFAVESLSRVIENPEQISLDALHGSLSSHWQKFSDLTKTPHTVKLLSIQTGPFKSSLLTNISSRLLKH